MLVRIAWRNLWRNPRRTILTLLAVAGGVTSMLAMYALMRASGDRLLEGLTGTFVGHVQIHAEDYRTTRLSSRTVHDADQVLEAVRNTPGVEGAAGRVYGFAHATVVRGEDEEVRTGGGEEVASPVVALLGIEPRHEQTVTDLAERVSEGRWIENETDVVIGYGIAERNGIEIGDAFLPSAVDTQGAMRGPWAVSQDVPRIVGIARSGIEQMDSRTVFMSRDYLSQLIRMESQVHEIAIRAADAEALDELVTQIERAVSEARQQTGDGPTLRATSPLIFASERGSSPPPAPAGDGAPTGDGGAPPAPPEHRFALIGVPVELSTDADDAAAPRLEKGRFLFRSEDMVLSANAAKALSLSPGDSAEVMVPVDCGEGIPEDQCPPSSQRFVVAGVVDQDEVMGGSFALIASAVLDGDIAGLAPTMVNDLAEGDSTRITAMVDGIQGEVEPTDEVLAWYDLSPEIHQMVSVMEVAPLIFVLIMYIAVVIGIVNTMLMATFERTRELGLMAALGMKPGKIISLVLTESALMGLVGVTIGVALGMGVVGYWATYGLDLSAFFGEGNEGFSMSGITFEAMLWPRIVVKDIIVSASAIGTLTTLAGLWPAIRAARLQPTEALRQD